MRQTIQFLAALIVVCAGFILPAPVHAQIINTIAGNGASAYSGDGGPATAAEMNGPRGVTVDGSGNVYIADEGNNLIRKVNTSGIISSFAGNGSHGYSGDGGPATSAELNLPLGVFVDGSGNVYIADTYNSLIRKVNSSGIISTVAGNGTAGYSGDGGAATAAELNDPYDVVVDGSGNLFIADYSNNRIREVNAAGIIRTIAGNGTAGYSGDGGAATAAELNTPSGVAFDGSGNVYIADYNNERVRKINTSGIITTFAGNGYGGDGGDGGAATAAEVDLPYGVTLDAGGNVYISDLATKDIRKVNTSGIISTCAGTGFSGFSGDGGPATAAEFSFVAGLAVDASSNLFIVDYGNNRIRKVTNAPTYCIPTYGDSTIACSSYHMAMSGFHVHGISGTAITDNTACDGTGYEDHTAMTANLLAGSAYTATVYTGPTYEMNEQTWIDFNNNGTFESTESVGGVNSYVDSVGYTITIPSSTSSGTYRMRVVTVYSSPTYPSIASCFSSGAYYYGETRDYTVTIGGTPTASASPDTLSFPATATGTCSATQTTILSASYLTPASGSITITAPTGYEVSADGSTWVTSFTVSYTGGTVSAFTIYCEFCPTSASSYSGCLSVTGGGLSGSLCVGVTGTGVANCSGTPSAGSASCTPSTGGATTAFTLTATGYTSAGYMMYYWESSSDGGTTWTPISGASSPTYNFTGISRNMCYRYWDSCLISGRSAVSSTSCVTYSSGSSCGGNIITTFAGVAGGGFSGDGGAATAAGLNNPYSVAVDGSGNVYIADMANARIRKVNSSGVISTIAGNGTAGYSGDGGAATAAELNQPEGVAVDGSGNIYIADFVNCRIRKVTPSGVITTFAGNGSASYSGDGGAATAASLNYPVGICVDGSGNVFIADQANNRVRRVSPAGIISTVAGNGTMSYSGDGGAATSAELFLPSDIAVDHSNNLYIADYDNNRVRKVNSTGIISTIAGNGTAGYSGDGGAATAAELHYPAGVAVDGSGNVYIAEYQNQRVRIVTPSGVINTFAGDGTGSFSGDGGPATAAGFAYPMSVALDASGNLYIVSPANDDVRKVSAGSSTVPAISGPTAVCVRDTITLADSLTGGAWSSSNVAVAVATSTGRVYGVSAGSVTISYSVTTSCGASVATYSVTVLPQPATPSLISGPTSVCSGATITLTDGVSGGTWSSSNTAIASVSSAGLVTGISAGTAVVSYTITNSCGSAAATSAITVNGTPTAGTISGSSTVCLGTPTTFTDGVSGGSWSSSNTAVASVNASSGLVSGVASGSATITYTVTTACGTASATKAVSVTHGPGGPAAISGVATVCVGASITLIDTTTGGAWSSSATTVASVSGSGLVTGISAGTTTISYTITNVCGSNSATKTITVNTSPSVAAISGTPSVCTGATTTLTDASGGGVWSSSNASIASISGAGVVTGIAAGSATISYTITSSCGTNFGTIAVTVNTVPSVGAISGSSSVCTGTSTTLSDATSGGTWSSTNTSVATINSGGSLFGVASGSTTISYTLTNGCGSAAATKAVAVNATPSAGVISGSSTVCTGSSTTLSDGTSGGTWSTSNAAIASVNTASGVVTGISAGSASMTYTVTGSCGTASAVFAMTVNASPSVGAISGGAAVCVGASITLSDATAGGTWSSSSTAVASTNAAGVVTGVTAGSVTISYSVTNTCGTAVATKSITVNPLPSAGSVTGPTTVCSGATITLTDASSGGTWSSSNLSVATINASGIVTGVSAGTTGISYTVTTACGTAVAGTVVNVSGLPSAGTISGASVVCTGALITLTDAVSGGVWSSSNTARATVTTAGVVSGVSAGSVTISYTVTSSCATVSATSTITVSAAASAGTISGVASVCTGSNITLTTSGTAGGTWTSSNTSLTTVSSGIVHGVAAGMVTISYSVTSSCGTVVSTKSVTVTATPAVTAIIGASNICIGTSSSFTDATSGGGWISSNTAIATVNSSGLVTGISAGTATLTYFVTNTCGTATTTKSITVNTLSAGVISGASSIAVGASTTLTNTVSGGTWSSASPAIASINSSGMVTGVAVGTDSLKYTVTNVCGTAVASKLMTVTAHRDELPAATVAQNNDININIYPNPNTGNCTIELSGTTGTATILLTDISGRTLETRTSDETKINLDMSGYATGTYLVKVNVDGKNYSTKVIRN